MAILDVLAAVWAWFRGRAATKAAAEVAEGKKVETAVDADIDTIDAELATQPASTSASAGGK
jgi:hypothetical protein